MGVTTITKGVTTITVGVTTITEGVTTSRTLRETYVLSPAYHMHSSQSQDLGHLLIAKAELKLGPKACYGAIPKLRYYLQYLQLYAIPLYWFLPTILGPL